MICHEKLATLWQRVILEAPADDRGIHGSLHWARVERNELYLARSSGADTNVVRLFALLHDSCRMNDGDDPEHGKRAAEYAIQLRSELTFLDSGAFDQLLFACTWHTALIHHANPTVQTCFDADRLDLGRIGISPDPKYLNTAEARAIARGERPGALETIHTRDVTLPR